MLIHCHSLSWPLRGHAPGKLPGKQAGEHNNYMLIAVTHYRPMVSQLHAFPIPLERLDASSSESIHCEPIQMGRHIVIVPGFLCDLLVGVPGPCRSSALVRVGPFAFPGWLVGWQRNRPTSLMHACPHRQNR